HIDAAPGGTTVRAAVQRADVALEVRAGGDPDGLRIAGHLADVATVGLPLGVERLEPRAGPVLASIGAGEEAGARDGEHGARPPPSDEDAVPVHGVVLHVLAVAHVPPSAAAVEAADDAAALDRPVDLPGIGRIDGELEHALGRVRPRPDGHVGEADGDGQLPPVVPAVLAPEDLAVLVARVE